MTQNGQRDTLTKAGIAQRIHQEVGLSKSDSLVMLEQLLGRMTAAFGEHEGLKLSRFGNFKVLKKSGRMGRNPKTRQVAPIPARRVVVFSAGRTMRQKILNRQQDERR